MKRVIAAMLGLLLLLTAVPLMAVSASADGNSGDCGDALLWEFDAESGQLTIFGTGNMTDYGIPAPTSPWSTYGQELTSAQIGDGVTGIGTAAFFGSSALETVLLPASVVSIHPLAFYNCGKMKNVFYAGTAEQWAAINIDILNDGLQRANIHYGVTDPAAHAILVGTQEPTYTTAGVHTYVCPCGYQWSEEFGLPLPHTHVFTDTTIAPTCVSSGYTQRVCGVCGETEYVDLVPALGHSYGFPVSADDSVHVHTCTRCGSEHSEAHTFENGVCSSCGGISVPASESSELRIESARLHLDQDIDIYYSITLPEGYENPFMTFASTTGVETVTEWTEESDGTLCFAYTGITPQRMGDIIYATLYAEKNGETYFLRAPEYSVRQYCANLLEKEPDNAPLVTLLSDLLAYGAAAQSYTSYKTDAMVTSGLTTQPSSFRAVSGYAPSFEGTPDADTCWVGAGLTLSDNVSMRFRFCTDDIAGLSVKIAVDGTPAETITAFSEDNGYYIATFCGIGAADFAKPITASFERNGIPIGDTVSYSVNAYICAKQHSTDAKLRTLVRRLSNYGASACAYLEANATKYYTVTFADYNGTVLKTETVPEGGSATPPAEPVREAYDFVGWNGDYTNVSTNVTITADYVLHTSPPIGELPGIDLESYRMIAQPS